MVDALRDSLGRPGYGYCSLRGVGEHLRGHLDGGSGNLPDLFNLGATLSNEGTTLRGRHDQPQGDGRTLAGPEAAVVLVHLTEELQKGKRGQTRVKHGGYSYQTRWLPPRWLGQ